MAGIAGLMMISLPAIAVAEEDEETYRQLTLFGDILERIRDEYVEEVSASELIDAAIEGMIDSLDPHSKYHNPKSYKEVQVQARGEFGGLGIEVTMENGLVRVISPIDDTPAQRAGIEAGDLVTHLDDEPVLGLTLQQAVDKMRGPPDSEITLTIQRDGVEEELKFPITRAIIKIRSVRARVVDDEIILARISTFSEHTSDDLDGVLGDLWEEQDDDVLGVVLDLRNNPGGLLDQAIAVSDAFLEQGEIVSTRGRDPDSIFRFNAQEGDVIDGLPLVVLINSGTASASEIVAGALQDHGRALILGTRSFGKGSVQTVLPLGGRGALRLTTARYYTPSGRSIQEQGIDPDIFVEQIRPELEAEELPERREEDLRGHLDNDGADIEEEDDPPAEEAAQAEDDPADGDYQLARAIEHLRGAHILSGNAIVN
ncbi:MAG: S41 family peptidase [Rhodospirillaceae bacterium]|nr:S41 family peptidase [Rhodospirillaceae bacterium]